MKIDAQQLFSDAQSLSGAGAAASTNFFDLGVARDLFAGEPLTIAVSVGVSADLADGDETYQFDVETDDNSGFSSATVVATRTIAKEDLVAGSLHLIPVPATADIERYLRLNYTLGGTSPSITVTSWLGMLSLIEKRRDYPKNYTISG